MAKFTGSEIDDLGFDFTKVLPEEREDLPGYTPGPHTLQEPTTVQIISYLGAYASLMRSNAIKVQQWQAQLNRIQGDDAQADAQREQTTAEYEKWSDANAVSTYDQRCTLLANLCTPDPDEDDFTERAAMFKAVLKALPARWLDGFESYMQDEMTGKAMSASTG